MYLQQRAKTILFVSIVRNNVSSESWSSKWVVRVHGANIWRQRVPNCGTPHRKRVPLLPNGVLVCSGAGTNLKVGVTGPAQKWGHRSGAINFFGSKSSFVWWALSWWSVQFGQFLVCCSSTHGAPCPAICKSGGHVPPRALWSRRHCLYVEWQSLLHRWYEIFCL